MSSFKDKHKQMKEGVDFIKIKDYAVINLNNMIPVPDSQIVNIDINKEKDASYRYLLQAESREVNRQKNRIRKNAEIVYSHKKHNEVSTPLAKRTNDFDMLEKLCKEYWEYAGSVFIYPPGISPHSRFVLFAALEYSLPLYWIAEKTSKN